MSQYAVVLITAPDEQTAEMIAKALVEQELAACVNIIPSIRSIYSWDGSICDDSEVMMVVKTIAEKFDKLEAVVKDIHSYDVPEIILLPIEKGSKNYLQWIDTCVSI
ncbi:MAG: divalent-cation tolerance protein CutA [Vampirovibrionia bacterium]